MLTNVGNLSFNQLGYLLICPKKVHINESSMENILSFAEVAYITEAHIKMDTYKGKVINVHIKDRKIIHFKVCAEGISFTNLNYPTMIINPTKAPLNSYSYLYTVFKNSDFY